MQGSVETGTEACSSIKLVEHGDGEVGIASSAVIPQKKVVKRKV